MNYEQPQYEIERYGPWDRIRRLTYQPDRVDCLSWYSINITLTEY